MAARAPTQIIPHGLTFPARIYNGAEILRLTPGTWKSSVGSFTFTDVSHQRYCTNGKSVTEAAYTEGRVMTVFDETFERTVRGVWQESTSAVEIASNTIAGSDKAGSLAYGVTVDAVSVRKDDGSTALTLTVMRGDAPAAEKFVHLVKCATATGTITAQLINGTYTIPAEAQSVSIETALLGDANEDGSIKATDLLIMKQIIVKARIPSELQLLALDIDGNKKIIATDLLRIKQNIVKKM